MASVKVKIDGLKELGKAMQDLGKKASNRIAVCLPYHLRLKLSVLPQTANRTVWQIKRYGQAIQRLSTANLLIRIPLMPV